MDLPRGDEVRLDEDRRAAWRGTWALGLGFLLVATLMRTTGAGTWLIFGAFGALCVAVGTHALASRSKPVLGVSSEGLRFFAGEVGLGGLGGGSENLVPWDAITGFGYELRHRNRGRRREVYEVLCFTLDPAIERPDGHRGFLEPLVGQRGEHALGEFFVWDGARGKVDLLAMPQGGHGALIEAIRRFAPSLGEPVRERRKGLGGPISYALLDAALAASVVTAVVVLLANRGEVIGELLASVS